jgi:hypothetical protein
MRFDFKPLQRTTQFSHCSDKQHERAELGSMNSNNEAVRAVEQLGL